MKIIMLSTDRRIFEDSSAVRARMLDYGALFSELHIIVFAKRFNNYDLRFGEPEGKRIAPNVFVYSTDSRNRWFFIFDAIRIGRRIIRRWRPSKITGYLRVSDIVVTAQDPFETGVAGFLIAKFAKAGLQIQIHTDFTGERFSKESVLNKIRVYLAKFIIPRARAVRVVSDELAEAIKSFGVPAEKIQVLPIFIDAKSITSAKPTFNLKKRYPQFRFIILAAGRLEGEKRFDVALDVLAKVIKKYPFTGLVIVGDGSKRLSLAEKALSLGLDNNVIFEPWQDGIISHLKTANVLLLTSEYEGYGLVLIEAGLAGCPIVSSNVGIAGKLGRNDAALICEFGDISCFASAVISIIENNEARELIRARAKAFIEEFLFSKRKYLIEFKKGMEAALASKHQDI